MSSDVRLSSVEGVWIVSDVQGQAIEILGPSEDTMILVDPANPSQFAIRTGAQFAPIGVSARHLESAPGDVDDQWEESVEFSVASRNGLEVRELFGDARMKVSQAGSVRIRINASGRLRGEARGDVGSRAKIIERYELVTWNAPLSDPYLLRAPEAPAKLQRVHLEAARSAAHRIGAALDSVEARNLVTDLSGTAGASFYYERRRRSLFPRFVNLAGWQSGMSSGQSDVAVGGTFALEHNRIQKEIFDGIPTGRRSHVVCRYEKLQVPEFAELSWNWYVPGPDNGASLASQLQPLLDVASRVSLRFDEVSGGGGGVKGTKVTVVHAGLPRAWQDDMELIWACKLEAGSLVWGF